MMAEIKGCKCHFNVLRRKLMLKSIICILFVFSFSACVSKKDANIPKETLVAKKTEAVDLKTAFGTAQELLYLGNYSEALEYVNQCLEQEPRNLAFLANLDIIYNGTGEYEKAEKLKNEIKEIWKKDKKELWLKKGSPKSESTWARYLRKTGDYYVIGTEYFEPEVVGDEVARITNYYKIIMQPTSANTGHRLFKLEMSDLVGKYHVLSEFKDDRIEQVIPYGSIMPSFQQLMKDFEKYLTKNNN